MPRPAEGRFEQLAREIVAHELGVEVTRFDDGSAPLQVDAMIHLPGGHVPLEVVADHHVEHERQWNALDKLGRSIDLAPDAAGWWVTIEHTADVRRLRTELPAMLAALPDEGERDILEPDIPGEFYALGVVGLQPLERPGVAYLSDEGWNSWDDPVQLNDWVERVLAREADVPKKLRKVEAVERHAFIWATIGSAWWVNRQLIWDDEDDEDGELPTAGPPLPEGVTHVWVAAYITRRGCLYYSERDGWRRADWLADE